MASGCLDELGLTGVEAAWRPDYLGGARMDVLAFCCYEKPSYINLKGEVVCVSVNRLGSFCSGAGVDVEEHGRS